MMFFPKAATLADFANQSGRWIRGSRAAMAYLYCDTFSAALKAYISSTSIVLTALINCDDNDSCLKWYTTSMSNAIIELMFENVKSCALGRSHLHASPPKSPMMPP